MIPSVETIPLTFDFRIPAVVGRVTIPVKTGFSLGANGDNTVGSSLAVVIAPSEILLLVIAEARIWIPPIVPLAIFAPVIAPLAILSVVIAELEISDATINELVKEPLASEWTTPAPIELIVKLGVIRAILFKST